MKHEKERLDPVYNKVRDKSKRAFLESKYKYGQPIFGDRPGTWQFDTVFEDPNGTNKPMLFFTNVNTKQVRAYAMDSKDEFGVRGAMNKFLNDEKQNGRRVNCLTSDEDPAYTTADMKKLYAKHGIKHRTTNENNHNILGVLNRAVKTYRFRMRDDEQDYSRRKDPYAKINANIRDYNKTVNKATGITPNEMANNEELEIDHIARKMNEADERREKIMEKFKAGDGVRVWNQVEGNFRGKAPYNLAPSQYMIAGFEGNHAEIRGKDPNTTMSVPFYKLDKLDKITNLASMPTKKSLRSGTAQGESNGGKLRLEKVNLKNTRNSGMSSLLTKTRRRVKPVVDS